MIQSVKSGFLEGRVPGMCCFPGPPSVATLVLAQRCAHHRDMQRMKRQSCCTEIFLWWPRCSILKIVGVFFPLFEWHKGIVNRVQDQNAKEKSAELATKTDMSINGWKEKPIRKCPCVIICAISSITEHGCFSVPLKMRVVAVHTTAKQRSGNMVTILNMSRFAMSNSIACAIYFILLFSWHNSSFHFILAPFLFTLSVLESVSSHLWNSCSMPHTWMLN